MKILKASSCFELMKSSPEIQCIDVREPYEYEFGNCGFQNIPMETLRHKADLLNKNLHTILICRSGKRAEAIGNLLEVEHGFEFIIIVENGILGWQDEIDSNLTIY
jgi:rhodanese-related sulfurtransferase